MLQSTQTTISLKLKATYIGAQAIGGLLFGIGWAILGYCPGTAVGAVGEGRWHATWGVMGMLVRAAIYAELYTLMKRTVLTWGNFGKITIPEILHINHWIIIIVFIGVGVFLFSWFNRKHL